MYAIAFDLDTECLKKSYPGANYQNAYGEIRAFLEGHDFTNRQGSLYYGGKKTTMVSAVLAATELGKTFPWLSGCVTDIRILQLMNNDDLLPAVELGISMGKPPSKKK